jgi:hypothetical protein
MEAKIKKAQTIANKTGETQVVIKSCYGWDIAPKSVVMPTGTTLSGCQFWIVRPVAA